ncbi:MAG: hypothetical protein QOJ34_2226 [Pseudonocardiales bacterium]|nr:hypothetical protein [Pseudonocardiales bacterium]
MARHAKVVDPRLRVVRLSIVVVIWAYGLVAGLYALLAGAAKFGCMRGDGGLACRTSGSVLGVVLLVTVAAVVMLVTLASANRSERRVLIIGGVGVAALTACLVAALSLLATA